MQSIEKMDREHIESSKTVTPEGSPERYKEPQGHVVQTTTTRSTQGELESDNVNVKRTLRKMDARILPVVAILYLFSFLDRG